VAEGDFVDTCAALWRGFRPTGALLPARKSEVLPGELDGMAVVAKRLARPNAVWQWYWEREVAIYRAFAATPPSFRVPRFVAADDERGILVIERLPGVQLATRRHPHAELGDAVIGDLVELRARIAAWPGAFPTVEPPPAVRTELRRRLLEDPTGDWIREGIWRGVELAILDNGDGNLLSDAISDHDATAMCHGDLLLRNALIDGDAVGVADWECAGLHLADWDLALVWAQLGPTARAALEARVDAGPRRCAFLAIGAFALVREVSFLRVFRQGKRTRGVDALLGDLGRTIAQVRALRT
jgi:aminoglycoside phosphotransferase (APT) family kinase protein